MRNRSHRTVRCRAFTLVEVLLAAGVLAVLAAVTVPSVVRIFRQTQMSEVVEQVRGQVAGARARAIESGLVYQFRFEPEGRGYLSIPFEREMEVPSSTGTGTGGSTGVGQYSKFAGELPEGFQFVDCCAPTGSTAGPLSEEALAGLPNASALQGRSWSAPILFLAAGSASADAAFEITDRHQQAVRFEIRGLTGSVAVGRITGGGGR
jgi:prepilin-type N-terminal cleavage/methylation domain-containing protein